MVHHGKAGLAHKKEGARICANAVEINKIIDVVFSKSMSSSKCKVDIHVSNNYSNHLHIKLNTPNVFDVKCTYMAIFKHLYICMFDQIQHKFSELDLEKN